MLGTSHRIVILGLLLMALTTSPLLGCDTGADDGTRPRQGVLTGDVNGDGLLSCADLEAVEACLHGGSCAGADINGDGAVNDADARTLYNTLTNQGQRCVEPHGH